MAAISNMGEVHLFTASTRQYADPIIDEIDPKGFIKKRFYREVTPQSDPRSTANRTSKGRCSSPWIS